MTVEPDFPRAENSSQAGNIPQSQAGMTATGTRPPFDFGRLRPGDLIAGIASLLVLISVFVPWYTFAAAAGADGSNATPAQQQLVLAICGDQPAVCSSDAPPRVSVTALGGGAGGWRYLILVVAIIGVLYVLSRAAAATAQVVPYHWQILIGLTAVQGLLVLIAFFDNPLDILDSFGSSSWAAGAFIGLIAAIAAMVAAIRVMQENKGPRALGPTHPGTTAEG